MPTYNISVVIDPANASQGARVVEARLEGVATKASAVDTAVQRAFDFNTGPAVTATSAVDKALEGVTQSANATGAAVASAMNRASQSAVDANKKILNSDRQVAASKVSLGAQFNDFSTSVLGGASVATAFAQQAGQAAFALQGFNGVLGTVGRFLAGPWGTVLIIATTILGNFVSKLLESKDKTEAAEKALKDFQNAQSNLSNFIDATTGKLLRQAGAFAEIARNAKLAQIAQVQQSSTQSKTDAFAAAATARGSNTPIYTAGGVTQPKVDPDIDRAIKAANGDVVKLSSAILQLSRTSRPDLKKLAGDITNLGGAAITSEFQAKRLQGEVQDLNTALKGGVVVTSGLIERQVALSTATTAVERAQAKLNDVRSRGNAIDKIADPAQRRAALAQYRTDLTGATVAVNNAQQAQKDATKATAAHNKELREQAAAARKAAVELDRESDFIAKLVDQGKALEERGTASAISAQVDAFSRQFNKAPSDTQRKQIEDAVKRNQLLGDEKAILDQLLGPLESYQRSLSALNDLLAKGKITQDQYNQSLRELPLAQALASVDKQLDGTLFQYQAQLDAINDTIAKAVKTVDDAEKAGIIDPAEAERRRVALRGPTAANDEIVVNGGPPTNQRDQMRADLDRQRREPLRRLDESLDNRPDLQKEAKFKGVDNEQAEQMRILAEARNQELITDQEYQDRKTAIVETAEQKRKAIEDAITATRLTAAQTAADSLLAVAEAYAGKQSGIYKGIFLVSKAFAIAQAVLALQQNIAEASKYGFPQNIPFIAGAVAQGASILTSIQGVASQFQSGGYTGDGGESEPAGVVHGKEFVMNARATRENRAILEAMNNGRTVRAARSTANDSGPSAGRPLNVRVDTTDFPGATGEVRYITADEAEIRIKRGVARDSGKTVASELRNPNSRPSKALTRTTSARRKRG